MNLIDSARLYRLLRTVHLWAALTLAAGVAMYTLTGWLLLHPELLPENRRDASRSVDVAALTDAPSPRPQASLAGEIEDPATREVGAILSEGLRLRGRLEEVRRGRNGWTLTFRRPGTIETVRWIPGNSEVELNVQSTGPRMVSNRLHHLHGYGGGLRFALWAAFLDAVSLSMFLFAGTGIYLWYQTKKDRRLGWILLGGSTAFACLAIIHLVWAK